MTSPSFHLNSEDLQKWVKNTLLFSTPAILAFLVSLQTGADTRIALSMAYQAMLAALIDLFRKFLADNTQ